MDKKFFVLNICYAVFDTILSGAGIALFGWCAWHFEKWWMVLFALIPLALYTQHSVIIDADIRQAEVDKLSPQKGGDNDAS